MVKRPVPRLAAAARRRQIIDRALPVFARSGRAGTGTRQLAAAAGVSEPILYRHFRSKDALFFAVLDLTAQRLAGAIDAAMAPAADARARLLTLAHALPELIARHTDDLRILCGAAAARDDAATTRAVQAALTKIGQVLQRGFAGGGLRAGVSPQLAAYFLLEIGLGAALLRPSGVPAPGRGGFGRKVADLMLAALLPDGASAD